MEARAFLRAKILSLAARARRLAQVYYASVGIRPQDLPYAPSPAHFQAANDRLAAIDGEIERRLRALQQTWEHAPLERVLHGAALVEREIDRARRAWGLFFEVFSQRGSAFAPVLAAHDVIAADCYAAATHAVPGLLRASRLKPLTYIRAATRRHVAARRPAQPAARRGEPVPADPRPMGSRQSLAGGFSARGRTQFAGRSRHLAGEPGRGGDPVVAQ